ncbi:MAG: type II 3-dehydroquinate dehydratase [Bacteroidales bacterium]|nr:type II 3-dehydroquinate dehydratase [Bacteroidales bacterium]
MKKILIINGPNLNLLGSREPSVYGTQSWPEMLDQLRKHFHGAAELEYFQSNHEGDIIDCLQRTECEGVVLNAGAYTHTSLAIADCIAAIDVPVIEVHISNVAAREEIRRRSLIAPSCRGVISGLGMKSYMLAIQYFLL